MKINTNALFRQATIRICGTLDIQPAVARSFQFIINDYPPVERMRQDPQHASDTSVLILPR